MFRTATSESGAAVFKQQKHIGKDWDFHFL